MTKPAPTKPIPNARTKPESVPSEAHGGDNSGGQRSRQGKEGNGAQKRQQKKK